MIKTNAELAKAIEGKTIVLLNSLGKDSIACLEWLYFYAKPKRIISIYLQLQAEHPDDQRYIRYLQNRYLGIEWHFSQSVFEVNLVLAGTYQPPYRMLKHHNHYEYTHFDFKIQKEELLKKFGADYLCSGESKYESFKRAVDANKFGLIRKGVIYPIGLWTKETLIDFIRQRGFKIHPCYKYTSSSYDHPSFYKMRASIIAKPSFWQRLLNVFPLMVLDRFRYEKMIKKKGKAICR